MQRGILDALDARARRGERLGGRYDARSACDVGVGNRPLLEAEPADAAPTEMRVDAGDELVAHVLQLERETAFDANHQRRRLRRGVGLAGRRTRRPDELDRPRRRGEALADDVVPIQDKIRFAEALAG